MFHWFSGKKKQPPHEQDRSHDAATSGLSRLESTKPHNQARHGSGGNAQPGNRKQERLERRELLYAVVREAMVRAGVLSSSYKFKVLSLDQRGRQFLVMVDLAEGAASDTHRLAEIEAMVAQSAKARYDILVAAVYWRANEHVAIGDPAHFTSPKPLISQPAPLEATPSRPTPLEPQARTRVEPLQAEEVAAFRKALDAGVRGEKALASANKGKEPRAYTLLTGFEDTELSEGDVREHLSGTQWGTLR